MKKYLIASLKKDGMDDHHMNQIAVKYNRESAISGHTANSSSQYVFLKISKLESLTNISLLLKIGRVQSIYEVSNSLMHNPSFGVCSASCTVFRL